MGGFTGPWAARRENVDRPGLWHNHGAFLDAGHVEAWDNAPPLQTYDPNLKDYVGWYRHYYYGGFYGALWYGRGPRNKTTRLTHNLALNSIFIAIL